MRYLKKFNDSFIYVYSELKDIREVVNDLLVRTSDDYEVLISYDQDKSEVSININKNDYSITYWKYIKEDILRFILIFNDYYDKHDEIDYIFLVKYNSKFINDDELKNLSDEFFFYKLTIVLKFNNDYINRSLWLK